MTLFLGSEIYRGSSYGDWHPLRVPRVSTVMDLARALGWLPPEMYRTSPRAKPAALEVWHAPDYLAALQRAEREGDLPEDSRRRYALGTPSNPIFPEVYRRPATGAGGALWAGEVLRAPGIIHLPGGGTHHGMPAQANGFCYLNDCVLAILALRRAGLRRVAYVDIDAHYPDGVAAAFGDAADVLMISVHEAGRWPRQGHEADRGAGGCQVNLPIPAGSHDGDLHAILDGVALPWIEAFRPDAIVLQCGADGVVEDPQSRLAYSNRVYGAWVRAMRARTDRLLVLGGGGYNPWSVGRAWTAIWGEIIGAEVPARLPDPARAVLEALTWTRAGRAVTPPRAWVETLLDDPREGPVSAEVTGMVDRHRRRLEAFEQGATAGA
ncbi:MAG: acetoin utilization protein AcuC [Pseudomonadota bacterium]